MPDLSAYIDFDVTLDYSEPEIRLTDTSNYPVGVNTGIIGIVTITQPDGVVVAGDWNNPDVTWNGSALTVAVKELRTTAQNTPQCGIYTILYQVHHPDYTPTTLQRSFTINIVYPELEITDDFDVFTPALELTDDTTYTLSGFDAPTITRDWDIAVGSVTTITSSQQTVDLIFNGNYYDAVYTVDFTATVEQDHTTYDYLSVIYELSFEGTFNADTPPPFDELVECLTELKILVNQQADADCCSTLENKYGKAERRLSHLYHMLLAGETDGAFDLLEEFIDLTNCDHGVNRNEPIEPYVLPDSGGGSTQKQPRTFIVGTTSGAPTAGTSTWTLPAFIDSWVIVILGRSIILDLTDAGDGGIYVTKTLSSNTLTVNNYTWNTGDILTYILITP